MNRSRERAMACGPGTAAVGGPAHTPNFCGAAPLPALPTGAPPGTLDWYAAMHARVARGESLNHPLDAKYDLS